MAAESGTQSSPASQGTSGYQEALGGIDKTVSTAGLVYSAIDQYVAAPYSRWRLSTQKSNDARLALGEWHEYLYNPAGKFYMNPVLSEIGLQAHLKSSRGQATPQGPCKATARWAQLLHALEIRPETGIVSRNTSEQHKDVDTLRLEVEGSAMCHVINLFCVRPSRRGETQLRLTGSGVSGNPDTFSSKVYAPPLYLSRGSTRCELQFGSIEWELEASGTSPPCLNFRPAAEIHLNACHFPFNGWWNAAPDMVVRDYLSALDEGVSDDAYAWAEPTESLPTRISALTRNTVTPNVFLDRERPVVLTETWLSSAAYMKRRLTEGRSADGSFEQDCVRTVQNKYEGVTDDNYRACFPDDKPVPEWLLVPSTSSPRQASLQQRIAKEILRFIFLWFHSPDYTLTCEADEPRRRSGRRSEYGEAAIRKTLEEYESSDPGSWRHDLWESRISIMDLVRNDSEDLWTINRINVLRGLGSKERRMFVVPFHKQSWLWNQSTVVIG